MKAIKIIVFTLAVVGVTILMESMFKKEPPEPDYKIILSNTGYIFFDADNFIAYIDYTDSDRITNVISKEETKPKQKVKTKKN